MDKEEERSDYWPRVVREAQKYGGLTLQGLADFLRVSRREVCHWKAGDSRPTGMIAVRLYEYRCGVMSCTVCHSQQTGKSAM